MPEGGALAVVDELVMEYLLFRGFTKTFQVFRNQRRADSARGFQVDRLISAMLSYVKSYDIDSLVQLWRFLDDRFFSHLDGRYAATVTRLFTSLQRFYIVHAMRNGAKDKVRAFFEAYAEQLNAASLAGDGGGDDWRPWFALPYLPEPERDATFETYFSAAWQDNFIVSLRNFLSLIFQNVPLPALLAYDVTRLRIAALECELEAAQAEVAKLRNDMEQTDAKCKSLRKMGNDLVRYVREQHMLDGKESSSLFDTLSSDELHGILSEFSAASPRKGGGGGAASGGGGRSGEADASTLPWRGPLVMDESYASSDRSTLSPKADSHGGTGPAPSPAASRAGRRHGEDSDGDEDAGGAASASAIGSPVRMATDDSLDEGDDRMAASPSSERGDSGVGDGDGGDGGLYGEEEGAHAGSDSMDTLSDSKLGECERRVEVTRSVALCGHSACINVARFSHDGAILASGSKDATLRLWRSSDGSELDCVYSTTDILSMDWLPLHEGLLLFGSSDRSIKAWSVSKRRVVADMMAAPDSPRVLDLAASPSGNSFVSALGGSRSSGCRGRLQTWSLKSGRVEQHLALEPEPTAVHSVAWNHNGSLLVAGAADGMVRVFDMGQGTAIMGWPAHDGPSVVRFSPDETSVISGGGDGRLLEWSLHRIGQVVRIFDIGAAKSPLFDDAAAAAAGAAGGGGGSTAAAATGAAAAVALDVASLSGGGGDGGAVAGVVDGMPASPRRTRPPRYDLSFSGDERSFIINLLGYPQLVAVDGSAPPTQLPLGDGDATAYSLAWHPLESLVAVATSSHRLLLQQLSWKDVGVV